MKNLFLKSFLIIFGLLLAVVLVEVSLRLIPKSKKERYEWARPSFYYRSASSASFRNYPFEQNKPASIFRIAVIGDSFTYPHLLQFDFAYPKVLERMLNLNVRPHDRINAEVINYGKAGLSTQTEINVLNKSFKDKPDLAILEITLNDAAQDTTARDIRNRFKGKCVFGDLKISQSETPLLYYSRLARLIASSWHNSKTSECFVKYHKDIFLNENSWKEFTNAIDHMIKISNENNVRFAAFIFPMIAMPLNETYPFLEVHKKISEYFAQKGLHCLDLLPTFENIPHEYLQIIPINDPHPNEIAHRIVAERVYLWLERKKLIPENLYIKEQYEKRTPPRIRRMPGGPLPQNQLFLINKAHAASRKHKLKTHHRHI